jgi:hypothetical protein
MGVKSSQAKSNAPLTLGGGCLGLEVAKGGVEVGRSLGSVMSSRGWVAEEVGGLPRHQGRLGR